MSSKAVIGTGIALLAILALFGWNPFVSHINAKEAVEADYTNFESGMRRRSWMGHATARKGDRAKVIVSMPVAGSLGKALGILLALFAVFLPDGSLLVTEKAAALYRVLEGGAEHEVTGVPEVQSRQDYPPQSGWYHSS